MAASRSSPFQNVPGTPLLYLNLHSSNCSPAAVVPQSVSIRGSTSNGSASWASPKTPSRPRLLNTTPTSTPQQLTPHLTPQLTPQSTPERWEVPSPRLERSSPSPLIKKVGIFLGNAEKDQQVPSTPTSSLNNDNGQSSSTPTNNDNNNGQSSSVLSPPSSSSSSSSKNRQEISENRNVRTVRPVRVTLLRTREQGGDNRFSENRNVRTVRVTLPRTREQGGHNREGRSDNNSSNLDLFDGGDDFFL